MSQSDDPKNQKPGEQTPVGGFVPTAIVPPTAEQNPHQPTEEQPAAAPKESGNLNNLISAAFSNVLANAPKPKPQDPVRFDPAMPAGLFGGGDANDPANSGDIEATVPSKPLMIGNVALVDYFNPWRIFVTVFAICVLTFAILWVRPPAWFAPIKAQMRHGAKVLHQTASGNIPFERAWNEMTRPVGRNTAVESSGAIADKNPTGTATVANTGPGACQLRINAFTSKNGSGKATKTDVLQAGQCYILMDDPQRAFPLVRSFHEQVPQRAPTSAGYLAGLPPEIIAGFWVELVTLAKFGRLEDVEKIVRPFCSQWAKTDDCVAKLYYLNIANYIPTAVQGLNAVAADTKRNLSGTTQLMAEKIAGEVADKSGDYAKATKHFANALAIAPALPTYLRKLTLESYTYAASRHEQIGDLAKIQQQAAILLNDEARSVRTKILLVAALYSKSANDVLKSVFARSDMNLRLRGDNRLLGILGDAAIRRHQAPAFAKYAQSNTDHLRVSYKASQPAIMNSEQWRARGLIAAGNPREALATLENVLRLSPKSATAWHLKGVALNQMWPQRGPGLVSAEKAFESAAGVNPQWQSLLALADTAGKNGNVAKQQVAIDRTKAMAKTEMALFWLKISQIKWHLNKGSVNQALAEIEKLAPADKNSVSALNLKVTALKELKRDKDAAQVDQQLDTIRNSADYVRSKEIKTNPLGPLALL